MTTEKIEKMALSPGECAELCGLHVNTIRKLVKEKRLGAIKLGRKILISKISLAEFLSGRSNQPPSAGATDS
jgi:excisionase family DNA binding protein